MTGPLHVLLVEDNAGDAELTRDTFEEGRLSVEITRVVDGIQALAYLRRQPPYAHARRPDLILLDLNLPKLSGIEVLAALKQHDALRSIPVVVLTSSDAQRDVVSSYQLGAACYVTKPLGLEEFQATVRSIEDFWLALARRA